MLRKAKVSILIIFTLVISVFMTLNAQAKLEDNMYNVKAPHYKATGNGIRDDSGKIQLAVNAALKAGGGTIYFPEGTYKIAQNITFPASLALNFEKGAKLEIEQGKHVTIWGSINDTMHQIFSGNAHIEGDIQNDIIRPEWWGAQKDGITDNAKAFQEMCQYVNSIQDRIPTVQFSPGTYVYGNYTLYMDAGLAFEREVVLKGDTGATLKYTGDKYAVKMGPDGVSVAQCFDHRIYEIDGITFTGGDQMIHGVYFNEYMISPVIRNCQFIDFGANPDTYGLFFQSNNWDIYITGCFWWTSTNRTDNGSWVRVNGYDKNGQRDWGQSQLRMYSCQSNNGTLNGGIGVYTNGFHTKIIGCSFQAFKTNIWLGPWANETIITESYFETISGTECIKYGDTTGPDAGNWLSGIAIKDCYANIHNYNLNAASSNAYFMAPSGANDGLQDCRFENIYVTGVKRGREVIKLNNHGNQSANYAVNIKVETAMVDENGDVVYWDPEQKTTPKMVKLTGDDVPVHTKGSNILAWEGNHGFIKVGPETEASKVPNGSIFMDISDGKLKYKNSSGVVITIK